jgi:hypothetical protein
VRIVNCGHHPPVRLAAEVVRPLLQHYGDGLTDDVLLVLGEPVDRV